MCRRLLTALLLPLVMTQVTAGYDDPPAGKKLALVVGVNQYDHSKLEKLRYAENDAADLATTLKAAKYEVVLLTTGDGSVGRPTKANVEKHITELLAKAKREDIVVVALAGHGVQFEGDEESFFCPADAAPLSDAKGRGSLVSLTKLYQQLDQSGAGVKLLLVDACRDDPTAGRGASRGIDGSAAPRLPKGTAVLVSCSAGERAFEHDNYRHGVFFHHVLEGLRGKAKNEEGEVTWDRLVDYVKRHVSRDVPKLIRGGARQSPVHFTGGIAGESPILIHPGQAQNVRASLDILYDYLDKESARKANLPQKMQPLVTFVVPGGGGDLMGLRPDDILLAINGRDNLTMSQFDEVQLQLSPSEKVALLIQRNGQKLTLTGAYETKMTLQEMFRRVREAAQNEDAWAMDALAFCFATGQGTPENEREAFRWFRKAAEKGVYCSKRWVAKFHAEGGDGIEKNEAEAIKWWQHTAEQGDPNSQNMLAVRLYDGTGVPSDVIEAMKWWKLAAEQGYDWAQYNIGVRCQEGKGIEKNEKEALTWLRKAADQKNADAIVAIGYAYQHGTGVEKNDDEAFTWIKKAADMGLPEAQRELANCHYAGRGTKEDKAEAVKWYAKAAAQNHAEAQNDLAECYGTGDGVEKDDREAFRWYKKAANQNHAEAQNAVGIYYHEGRGTAKDLVEGVKYYRKSAEAGYQWGQYNLGNCYYNGIGIKEDNVEAVAWFRKAAAQDNADAENKLGRCYDEGWGVAKDVAEAAKWYRKSADRGLAEAQYNLGLCYKLGSGVAENLDEAKKWFRKAAAQGHEDAKKELEEELASGAP